MNACLADLRYLRLLFTYFIICKVHKTENEPNDVENVVNRDKRVTVAFGFTQTFAQQKRV